jgi:hypothetical protein
MAFLIMSRIVTGGYRQAIDTVQRTLDTMNRLQGDELADARRSLRKLEGQAQRHFSRSYLRWVCDIKVGARRCGIGSAGGLRRRFTSVLRQMGPPALRGCRRTGTLG